MMADTINGVTLYTDETGRRQSIPSALVTAIASAVAAAVRPVEVDTQGNVVPTNLGHAYTYDGSGNLSTDTVTDGTNTWVRTYMWSNGAQTSDSGWMKRG